MAKNTVEFPECSIKDGHRYERQYTYDITNGYKLMDSLRTVISEDGMDDFLEDVKEELIKAGNEHKYASCPEYYCYFANDGKGDEINRAWGWFVWQLMVGMFGNFGTSIRGGWIERIDEALEFVDMFKNRKCPECGSFMDYRAYFSTKDGKEVYEPKWCCDECDKEYDLEEGE